MPEHSPSQTFIVDRLRIVGERLRRAREVLDEETDSAKATAIAAADAGARDPHRSRAWCWPRPNASQVAGQDV